MYRHGANITTILPNKERIPCKVKGMNFLETLIKGKESIQELYNPSKTAKEDSIIDERKHNPTKTPPPFKNKVDYRADTNEKTRKSQEYSSDTDGFSRNLGDKYKNKEY